ncbi:uncharacterized protein LOC106664519 isoform X2 [Cimex lectularius]|uniref:Disks large-associated protein 1 n=1 Tax=Cimex lectularius TaxID=79782 RepID=A0A8I6RLV1_CIMLE|nr:uncharacterized protein LOC106664519 isoform X2 [Cimex lectularius]
MRSSLRFQIQDTNSDLTNGNQTKNEGQVVIEEVHKQPSYVALACCISGYKTLSYDSKKRHRLRSRTVSPIRVEGNQNASFTNQRGNYLSSVPTRINSQMQSQGKDILNGGLGVANMPVTQENRNYRTSLVKESYSSYNTTTSRYSSYTETEYSTNGEHIKGSRLITPTNINEQLPPSSFIVQRVERLYGPGALAQGFYTSRKVNANREPPPTQETSLYSMTLPDQNEASLPVLKLLRPEFRAQLAVANRKTRASTPDKYRSVDEDSSMDRKAKARDDVDATALPVTSPLIEVKDGHYYLKLLSDQVNLLESLAVKAEKELETCDNEDASGVLRAAAGKARLLVSQKLNQFKGLCKKNIERSTGEHFPTTDEDLAGFWDMVMIQVNDVLAQFDKIAEMKKNNWKCVDKKPEMLRPGNRAATSTRKMAKKNELKDAPSMKARDEARKKLIEERRKALKEDKEKMNSDVLLL